MTTAFYVASVLLLIQLYSSSKPFWCYGAERIAARKFIRAECEQSVDDSLLGPQTTLGVARSFRFVCLLDGGKTCLFLIESHFFRGGFPEHDRAYLLSVDRSTKDVVECVTIESSLPAAVVRSRNEEQE